MESNEIKKALLDSYEILNDKKINDANFDKTIQGTIIDCKDPSIGRYLIRYQDSTIEDYSIVNDSVIRCVENTKGGN